MYLLFPRDEASHYVWPVYATIRYAINFLLFVNVAEDTPSLLSSDDVFGCGSHSLIHLA
jgi:hypothetical protein